MWKLHDKISQVHNSFPKMCVSEFRIFPILNLNFHSVHTMYCINFSTVSGATPAIKFRNCLRGSSIHMNSLQSLPPYMFVGNLGKIIVFRAVWVLRQEKKYGSVSQTQILLCKDFSPQILSMLLLVACAQDFLNPSNEHWIPNLSECASGEQSVNASFTNHLCYYSYSIFLELMPFKESPIIRINIFLQ